MLSSGATKQSVRDREFFFYFFDFFIYVSTFRGAVDDDLIALAVTFFFVEIHEK